MNVKAFSSAEDAFFIVSVRSWHCLSEPVLAKRKASFGARVESASMWKVIPVILTGNFSVPEW